MTFQWKSQEIKRSEVFHDSYVQATIQYSQLNANKINSLDLTSFTGILHIIYTTFIILQELWILLGGCLTEKN